MRVIKQGMDSDGIWEYRLIQNESGVKPDSFWVVSCEADYERIQEAFLTLEDQCEQTPLADVYLDLEPTTVRNLFRKVTMEVAFRKLIAEGDCDLY
jgi:hypothetical protein